MKINLSWTQSTILAMLERNPGKVVSHRALARKVWGSGLLPASWTVMLAGEIHRLRKNLPQLRFQHH